MCKLEWEDKTDYINTHILKYSSIGYIIFREKRYDVCRIEIERNYMYDWIDLNIYDLDINGVYGNKYSRRLEDFNEFKYKAEVVFKNEISTAKDIAKANFELPIHIQRILKIENILDN